LTSVKIKQSNLKVFFSPCFSSFWDFRLEESVHGTPNSLETLTCSITAISGSARGSQ
jgi:hypothetical protein